jgi:hypothetical protein
MTVLGIRSQMLWNITAYLKMSTLSIDVEGEPKKFIKLYPWMFYTDK